MLQSSAIYNDVVKKIIYYSLIGDDAETMLETVWTVNNFCWLFRQVCLRWYLKVSRFLYTSWHTSHLIFSLGACTVLRCLTTTCFRSLDFPQDIHSHVVPSFAMYCSTSHILALALVNKVSNSEPERCVLMKFSNFFFSTPVAELCTILVWYTTIIHSQHLFIQKEQVFDTKIVFFLHSSSRIMYYSSMVYYYNPLPAFRKIKCLIQK